MNRVAHLMKNIEDIKIELTSKILQRPLELSYVRKLPKDDELRSFICQFESEYAYLYALLVDEAPHPETRTAACKDPEYAYLYAYWIDKVPYPETRTAACKGPYLAYIYALYIDKKPTEETRTAACKNPEYAYYYALLVDEAPTKETKTTACKNPYWAKYYQRWEQRYIDLSHYPHKCPKCHSPAYISMTNNVDCSNKDCK